MVMSGWHPGFRILTAMAFTALAASALTAASGAVTDAATVVCPTVGTGGVVTPAPSERVDWSGCDLAGANMSAADLGESNLSQADLNGANLDGAEFFETSLYQASLDGASLNGAILTDASFEDANLTDASFSAAGFTHTHLNGANLSGANMSTANLDEVIPGGGITASPAPMLPASWVLESGYLLGPTANLGGAALSGANLSGLDLEGAFLDDANLSAANLTSTDLASAILSEANMTGANLTAAVFSKAEFDETNLAGADVSQADLSTADLTGVESGGITGTTSLLPANWAVASGFLIGPGVDLQLANASGADFAGLDLDGATLYGTDLANANLSHANLTSIQGAGADLENANLTDANLTEASMAGEAFGAGAPTLQGADMTGATMTWFNGEYLAGGPAVLPAHWIFADGFMLGPTANLTDDAGLTNTDLTGVDLDFANLPYFQFDHDNLTGASFWGSNAQAGDFNQDTWSDTICPDATNSNLYVSGCFSTRLYEFPGLISPRNGSTLRRSARRFTVMFRLEAASGGVITSAQAASLAASHGIEASLAGPRIKATTMTCSWSSAKGYFSCTFRIPSGVRTGSRYSYSITVRENQGGGFVLPPLFGRAANPERIHFR
jgi:uncharacterized protein YjbI with pentapeptide repeats